MPSKYGKFRIQAFSEFDEKLNTTKEHLAIFTENIFELNQPLVRIHSECLTGDVLGSLKCDCGDQLHLALKKISQDGGILLYLRQEGRDIGLLNKVNAYALQDRGLNTIDANLELGFAEDERDFTIAKEILKEFKISKLKLITNNPKKIDALNLDEDFEVLERVSVITECNTFNENYISTKKTSMGHLF